MKPTVFAASTSAPVGTRGAAPRSTRRAVRASRNATHRVPSTTTAPASIGKRSTCSAVGEGGGGATTTGCDGSKSPSPLIAWPPVIDAPTRSSATTFHRRASGSR